jgi:hypothetical protein
MCLSYSSLWTCVCSMTACAAPERVSSTEICAVPGRVCVSVLQLTVLPPNVVVLQQPVQPLDVSLFHCSLCCPWTCLFYSSLFCHWTCLFYRSLCCPWTCWCVCSAAVCTLPGGVCLVLHLGVYDQQKPVPCLCLLLYCLPQEHARLVRWYFFSLLG